MTNEIKLGTEKMPKKKKIASLDKRKARVGWIFVLPFILGFAFVYLPIVSESVMLAFSQLKVIPKVGGYTLENVGFDNFVYAFTQDAKFTELLATGIKELVFQVPAILLFSLFMAVLLNQKMAGRAAFRAIFFLPVVLATGIMESIEMQNVFDAASSIDKGSGSSSGLDLDVLKELFTNMKIGTGMADFVINLVDNSFSIISRSGVQMLIFLAGLQSISPAIYEACKIDGATGWETFWKITFPMISPMILVNAIYTIIDVFTTETNTVMSYISSSVGITEGQSTAMAWSYFLIVALIIAAVAGIMSMYVFYQRKD